MDGARSPTARELQFTLNWVERSGLLQEASAVKVRASTIPDAIADGYGVALLIHASRPDLLPSLHAYERGRGEAPRNWTLLRERVFRRLGRHFRSGVGDVERGLLSGRSAVDRRDAAMAFLCELRRALRFVEEKPKARHSASLPATKVEATLVSEAVLEARYERLRADLRRRDEASSRDLEEREAASLRFDEEIYKLRAKNLANLEETERAIAKLKVDAAASLAEAEALERDAEEAWGDVGAPPADGARQPAMDVLRALDRAALDDDSGDSSDASSEGSAPPPPPLTPPPLHCMPAAHLSFDRSPSPPPPPDDEGAPHPPPDDEGEPRPPPDNELDGIVFESIDEYHESHAREPPPPRAPPVALPPKRRTSDFFERLCPTHGAPYYESAATGESSWDHPAAGVVERVDADSGHAYFLDAATGRTAWAIEDL
ncbi:hypothetical protein SO694_00130073 [Aureococcus anophagefferens]|uniref:WW domain-containing protein n=1 Tax=Aureococcus anophagefferens TaxID=44056 RepID=A0ABR1GF63_AURAN